MAYVRYILLGIVVAALAVVTPAIAFFGIARIVEHAQIAERGVTTTAVVTKLEKFAGRSTRYHVDYRFKTKSGSSHVGKSDVDAATFKTLSVGRPIAVKYLSSHPDVSEAVNNVTLSLAYTMLFAAAMMALLGYFHFGTWRRLHAEIGWSPGRGWAPLLPTAR